MAFVTDFSKPAKGPARGISDSRVGVSGQGLCGRGKRRVGRIADGVKDVPDKTVSPNALDRAAREQRPKCRVVQRRKIGQSRWFGKAAGIAAIARSLCELVPWADGRCARSGVAA